MAARDVLSTYEAVRYWCRKFGQAYGNQLRCPKPDDKRHFDRIFLRWTLT
jgi:putative transposase